MAEYPTTGAFEVSEDPTCDEFAALLEAQLAANRQQVGAVAHETLVISSGVILPTVGTVLVDTEAYAIADDLTHIQTDNLPNGSELLLWANNISHVVTVKNGAGGSGQILTSDGEDYVLDETTKCIRLQRRGTYWAETSRASEAVIGLDEIIERADMLNRFVLRLYGGSGWPNTAGVIFYTAVGTQSCQCQATTTPSMAVNMHAGAGYYAGEPFEAVAASSSTMTAPTVNPRLDTISLNTVSGALTVTTGTEASSPTAPAVPSGHLGIASIYHRVGETVIKNSDDGTNGYIIDTRTKING